MSFKKQLKDGLLTNNPVLSQLLGMCSTMAITTTLFNGIGMGLSVMVILICSNVVISLLRKVIPDKIRIAAYIVVIAGFVTMVDLLLKAYVPALSESLGVFIPLIVVNCIILGRAEAYACKHSVAESARDGLMMGLAYAFSLLAMSIIRQLLGTGMLSLSNPMTNEVLFSIRLIPEGYEIGVFQTQTGAFMTFAVLAALVAAYKNKNDAKEAAAEKAALAAKKAAAAPVKEAAK